MDITTDGKRYGNLINLKPFSIDPRLGLELGYNHLFYLRGGIGNFQRILDDKDTNNVQKVTLFQPTFGLGVKLKSFCIDYAFSSLNLQSNPLYSHFISFKIDINKKVIQNQQPIPRLNKRQIKLISQPIVTKNNMHESN